MIIVRSPFRISLFGGSTDYKSFYEKHGSLVIGTTIDQYMYIGLRNRHEICGPESIFSYSVQEKVSNHLDLQHPVLNCLFRKYDTPVEMNLFSDIPARTGLGGSSSFVVGLLKAMYRLHKFEVSKRFLAQEAIKVEREYLSEPGGIQDQIWASYGGFNSIEIDKDAGFSVKPLPITEEFKTKLGKSMLLIYVKGKRSKDLAKSHENGEGYKLQIKEIAEEAYRCFESEDIVSIGNLLTESWNLKTKISPLISNKTIDKKISRILSVSGCYGAKLLGSGGSGFILCLCSDEAKKEIRDIFSSSILDVNLDVDGAKTIV